MRSNLKENVSNSSTILPIDKALEFMGDNSKYQKNVVSIISITWMFFSFLTMGLPFLFQEPVFKCKFSETDVQLQECSFQQACKAFSYEIDAGESENSLTMDFMLYCDRQYIIGIAGSIFFLGSAASGLVFPQLSNKKGRKYALCLSILVTGVSIIVCAFAKNIWQFIIMLFFCGLGYSGFETVSLVYISEISGEKFRNYSAISLGCAWSVAQILYGFLTYYVQSWRMQCIVLMGVPFLLMWFFANGYLLESPRFLVQRNRFAEARAMLDRICVRNKRPHLEYKLEGEEEEFEASAYGLILMEEPKKKQSEFLYEREQASNYGFLDLFRYSSLRNLTFFLVILWSFRYMIYFGQSFSLSSLGAEMHSNMTLTAVSETVAILMTGPIKTKMPRVAALFWFAIVTTLSCVSLIFLNIPENCYLDQQACIQKGLIVFSAIGIRFGITVFSGVLMNYTTERYPTVVRGLGYGICLTTSKIITIFVPLIVIYFQGLLLNPLSFLGFIGVGAAILCRFMKETQGQSIPDQIEEALITETPLIELANIPTGGNNSKIRYN